MSGVQQIIGNEVRVDEAGLFGRSAVAGSDEDRGGADGLAEKDVARFVADKDGLFGTKVTIDYGLKDQTCARFPAFAAVVWAVRADVDGIEPHASRRKAMAQAIMNSGESSLVEITAGNSRLIRDDNQSESSLLEFEQTLRRIRQQFDLLRVGDVSSIDIDRPIAIQKNISMVGYLEFALAQVAAFFPLLRWFVT